MISIIITSLKEPKTIGKAMSCFMNQKLKEKFEIIVICGDKETFNVAKKYSHQPNVFVHRDKGKGKPAALNLGVKKAKGNILVFSDGDVFIEEGALQPILEPLKEDEIGAVCGRPIPTNSRNSMLGFWAYVLAEIAHKRRLIATKKNKKFFCSGYFFAIREKLFPILPEELLSEDGFVSNKVYEKKYKISYSPKARVYVKYPENFSDWIKQKKRSVGGYNQIKKLTKIEIRSFRKEVAGGLSLLKLVSNLKEFFWLVCLFLARIYLWTLIYIDINLKKKSHKEIWVRVESTK